MGGRPPRPNPNRGTTVTDPKAERLLTLGRDTLRVSAESTDGRTVATVSYSRDDGIRLVTSRVIVCDCEFTYRVAWVVLRSVSAKGMQAAVFDLLHRLDDLHGEAVSPMLRDGLQRFIDTPAEVTP